MSTATWPRQTTARPWRGRWIWSRTTGLVVPGPEEPLGALDPGTSDQRVLLRRSFSLPSTPGRATLFATADARYAAWINGERVGSGPARHDADALTYDEWDVTALLRPGLNTIAVLARFYGHSVPWWTPSRASHTMGAGAFAAELEADGEGIVATDAEWIACDADAWTPAAPQGVLASQPAELFDARRLDPDWTTRPDPSGAWHPAREIREQSIIGPRGRTTPGGEPYGAVLPRQAPALAETPLALPTGELARSGSDAVAATTAQLVAALADDISTGRVTVLDVGRIVSGRLRLTFAGTAGDIVRGGLLEAVGPAAFESAAPLQLVLRDGETVIEPFDLVAGRFLVLSASAAEALPRLIRAELVETHRPRHGASFSSSDELLNRIVAVSLRTVDLSAADAYLDCPTRERRAWTGDAVVHQSVDLVANADWSLAVWNPQLLARPRPDGMLPMAAAGDFASPRIPPIPDWALHWIASVHNLFRYTGDRGLVGGLLPTVEGVLRWFLPYLRDGRLVDVPGWVLIDWSPVQVRGSSAALTALWARALRQFAEMASWQGDRGRADWADGLHADVRDGFEAYWDEARGAYRDNILPDGSLGSGVSEHVAAAAVLAGIVPADRRSDVRRLLTDRAVMFTRSPLADHGADQRGPSAGSPVWRRDEPDWDTERFVVGAQPFFRSLVHAAVAELGGDLLPLYRDWDLLLATGPTALRECWEGGSYCHGWSATVAHDVIVHTLGVTPELPGYERARVAPRPETLERVRAVVPTPHGAIDVRVEGDALTLATPVPATVRWNGEEHDLSPGTHVLSGAVR
ncbi:alpha-L-rhamnosidase-related protein [Microbacterium resistens]|uniref:alpha-L-rhamnosidase-related protein n=1 Tax=Microbacterium resistens TaxID=156977 RepID=UPI00083008FE|nr:alpha-L-rhamnosidase N-terminal domain-containing protein [Microbacterium resistens]